MAVGYTEVAHSHGHTTTRPLAESWNGNTWIQVPTVALAHSGASLNGVSCTSPSNCMAVGSVGTRGDPTLFTLAESWNGMSWSVVKTPHP